MIALIKIADRKFHGALLTLMRRGTTLDGFMPHDDGQDSNTPMETMQMKLTRDWHLFVESECTKRYGGAKFC